MPLTLTEKLDSRKWSTGDNASVEMVYILTCTSGDLSVKVLIENSTAESYDGLARQLPVLCFHRKRKTAQTRLGGLSGYSVYPTRS